MSAPDPAALLVEIAESRPPRLGSGRLVCVDGPAGSGKTTLADAVAGLRPDSRVVHMDDLYDGWDGLPRLDEQVAGLLAPLAEGRPGTYRRYDWHAGRYAETVLVDPVPLLVLEGVGAGSRTHRALTSALAWVSGGTPELRLARGIARDGEQMRPQWEQWRLDEDDLHSRLGTRDHADVVVDTGA